MKKLFRLIGVLVIVAIAFISGIGLGQEDLGEETRAVKFVAIVLGAAGGLSEDNLSAYLLAPVGSTDFISLDAGTLLAGIRQARIRGSLGDIRVPPESDLTPEGWVLQKHIKAYLITHAHLDHIAGLVMNAPDDTRKAILGIPSTLDYIRDHLFNGKIWPNFANEGAGPRLKKYSYVRLHPGQEHPIAGTSLTVEPFVLSHAGYPSSAFLIRSGGFYALYFGDTGPDAVEKSASLKAVWTRVAPLVREQKLCGLFLEVSYPEGRPDELLFGHLTPSWLIKELYQLAQLVDAPDPEQALRGLTVVVTHVKPSFELGPTPRHQVTQQLAELNNLGIRFVMAEQGQRIEF